MSFPKAQAVQSPGVKTIVAGAGTGANHKPENYKAPNGAPVFAKRPQVTPPPSPDKMQQASDKVNAGGTASGPGGTTTAGPKGPTPVPPIMDANAGTSSQD